LLEIPIGILPLIGFSLRVMAGLSFLLTVAFVVQLYRETDKGWYWLTLVLSVLLLAVSSWLTVFFPLERRCGLPFVNLLSDIGEIGGALLLAVSFYGMYKTMHDIRKRVE
jgi:uncharacterized membrane-anchored protein